MLTRAPSPPERRFERTPRDRSATLLTLLLLAFFTFALLEAVKHPPELDAYEDAGLTGP